VKRSGGAWGRLSTPGLGARLAAAALLALPCGARQEPSEAPAGTTAQEPVPPPQGGTPQEGPPPATQGPEPKGSEQPAPAQPAAAEPVVVEQPTVVPLPEIPPAYHAFEDIADLLQRMAQAVPQAARVIELPGGIGGRPLPALELGRPGDVPLAERPTVLLIGGLDGESLSGGEAVLACARKLLEAPDRLPADVAFVAVPWGAPEELARALAAAPKSSPSERPFDEDGDGALDEDPPDDVDGDGLALSMLLEDSAGPWTFSRDERLLASAGPGDGPRFRLVPEGRDDDGDGRFNEDGPGGVVPDRNFPLGREGAWRDARCGALPLCHPAARALADLALARRTAAVILLQGNHGGLAAPGGAPGPGDVALPLEGDRRLYERATETFLALTARRQSGMHTLRQARGCEVSGAALDWFYAGAGALALEIAPWGPTVEGGAEVIARDARYQDGGPLDRELRARPLASELDRAWALWLDNTRGGLGFVDWHPVEIGGAQALVGGWEARTIQDPPLESLPRALTGLPEFVAAVGSALPRLELRILESSRDGEVVHLSARVRNQGLMPTGLWGGQGPGSAGELGLELVVPPGAKLLAGEARVALGRLDGGEASRDIGWILLAPEDSTFKLRAQSELALPVEAEVRP
jgi:hypothetical protein